MGDHIVLIGEMGVGKTTVGALLARRLQRPFEDSDRDLELSQGLSAADLAASRGVAHLHELELETLQRQLLSKQPSVIAAAASVVDDARGRRLLTGQTVVLLTAPDAVLDSRRAWARHRRPMTLVEAETTRRRRGPLFSQLATIVIDTGRADISETVDEIVASMSDEP